MTCMYEVSVSDYILFARAKEVYKPTQRVIF